jgi:hypothetical protein
MESEWNSSGIQVEFLWNPGGIPMESRWNSYGIWVEFLWNLTGIPMDLLLLSVSHVILSISNFIHIVHTFGSCNPKESHLLFPHPFHYLLLQLSLLLTPAF